MVKWLVGLVAALGLAGAVAAEDKAGSISVQGEAKISAAPDTVCIHLAVVSEGERLGAVIKDNATQSAGVFSTLKDLKIDEKDYATTSFQLLPKYVHVKDEDEPKLVGYRVVNALAVRVRKAEQAGTVVDRLVAGGANRVTSVRFEVSNLDDLVKAARADAVKDAREKAAVMVAAASDKAVLGRPTSISGGDLGRYRNENMYDGAPAAATRSPGTKMAAGQQEFTLTVSVTFAIDQK